MIGGLGAGVERGREQIQCGSDHQARLLGPGGDGLSLHAVEALRYVSLAVFCVHVNAAL